MEKKKTQKNTIINKIAVSTFIAIFSLASAFAGTYAWFINNQEVAVSGGSFKVETVGDCDISSINLIKFDYKMNVYGEGVNQFTSIDYLTPETGKVTRYDYNEENNKFGYIQSRYYKWNASHGEWELSLEEPTGTDRGTIHSYADLPVSPSDGDYYLLDKDAKYYQWNTRKGAWTNSVICPHYRGVVANSGRLPTTDISTDDYYMVTSDDCYYIYRNSSWNNIGATEPDATTLQGYRGEKEYIDYLPSSPSNGDYYIVNNTTWTTVSVMNKYDPVDKVVLGNSLKDMNCNAVYEVTLRSASFTSASLDSLILKNTSKEKGENDLFLTTCADFDIFYKADLNVNTNTQFHARYYSWNGSKWNISGTAPETGNSKGVVTQANLPSPVLPHVNDYYKVLNPSVKYYKWNETSWDVSIEEPQGNFVRELDDDSALLNTGDYFEISDYSKKRYYPSYKDESTVMSEEEEIYYKISYLSSLKNSGDHVNFYGGDDITVPLDTNEAVDFVDDLLTFYININYAPSELDEDYASIIYQSDYRAVYDFMFKFMVKGRAE